MKIIIAWDDETPIKIIEHVEDINLKDVDQSRNFHMSIVNLVETAQSRLPAKQGRVEKGDDLHFKGSS